MNVTYVALQQLAIMTNTELARLYTASNAELEIARQSNQYTAQEVSALQDNAANSLDILLGRMDRMAQSAVLRVEKTHEDMTVDELMDGYVREMVSLYTVQPATWEQEVALSQDTAEDTFTLYGGITEFDEEHRDNHLTTLLNRLNGEAAQRVRDAGYTVND